jgi:hypothetical protein
MKRPLRLLAGLFSSNIAILSFLIIQSLLLSGCQLGKDDSNKASVDLTAWTDTVVIDEHKPLLSLSNQTDSTIEFHLKLNERFPMSTEDVISEIKKISTADSVESTVAAWKFTNNRTYHLPDYSNQPWINDPIIVFNSLGGGLCGSRSEVLASICHVLGYDSRVVSLTGHVVSEVKEQGLWRLYDVDRGVYYADSANHIVSVNYLAKHSCDELKVIGSDGINELLSACGWTDSNHHMKQFSSTEDNSFKNRRPADLKPIEDLSFRLPVGSTLLFVEGDKRQPPMAVVKLTEASKGELKIPLVPYNWKGKGSFVVDDLRMDSSSDKAIALPKQKFINSIQILSIQDSAYIYYRLNPKIFQLGDTNTINIQGYAGTLKVEQAAPVPLIYDSLIGVSMRYEDLQYDHVDFLNTLIQHSQKVDRVSARKLYGQFVQLDKGLTAEEQKFMLSRYDTEFQLIWDTLGIGNEKLGWEVMNIHMPLSLFITFMTIRYDYHDFLYYRYSSDPDIPRHLYTGN